MKEEREIVEHPKDWRGSNSWKKGTRERGEKCVVIWGDQGPGEGRNGSGEKSERPSRRVGGILG